MSAEYRIVEKTTDGVITFIPQVKYGAEGIWHVINDTISLSKEGAGVVIENYIRMGDTKEIIHNYKPSNLKPLFG